MGCLSEPLRQAMMAALAAGGQVILLLNRRGFHTFALCPRCGEVVKCHACDVAMTYHKKRHILICHTCDAERPCPPACPRCGAPKLYYGGIGTERLEREIQLAFPDFPARRMDSDTMRGSGSHERVLKAFQTGDVRILLGTQMIAKGLDFPNVTLVGVVSADTALHLAGFPRRREDVSARGAGGGPHWQRRQARPRSSCRLMHLTIRPFAWPHPMTSWVSPRTSCRFAQQYGVPPLWQIGQGHRSGRRPKRTFNHT